MEKGIEVFAALTLSVIALSHLLQSRAWVEFFIWLRGKGYAGVLAAALLSLNFGALVVAFHNVWHGWPIILTLVGWASVLKGGVYLVAPQIGMRALERVSPERSREFVAAGAVMLALSAAMWCIVLIH